MPLGEDNLPYQSPSAAVNLSTAAADDVLLAYLGNANRDYYLSVFAKFASGGGILSWNWAAFLVTAPWFIYRCLFSWFLVFWLGMPIIAIAVGIIFFALHPYAGLAAYFVIHFCLAPIFANYIYYRRVREHVASAKRLSPRRETQIAEAGRLGGTNATGAWVFAIIAYPLLAYTMYQGYTTYRVLWDLQIQPPEQQASS